MKVLNILSLHILLLCISLIYFSDFFKFNFLFQKQCDFLIIPERLANNRNKNENSIKFN